MPLKTYSGSCHCGALRFEADLDLAAGSNRCNCSYCAKVRAWFALARGVEHFRLLEGSTASVYRWTPPEDTEPHLAFTFCKVCGVRTFARGDHESLGGVFHAISVPALDMSIDERASIPVRYINGRDRRYDETPEHTEAL